MSASKTLSLFLQEPFTGKQPSAEEVALVEIISAVASGVQQIQKAIVHAPIEQQASVSGHTNVQGESTIVLDEYSDATLLECLSRCPGVAALVSEEQKSVVLVPDAPATAPYVVAFDPLDGSSNVGSNIPVGTIFTVFRRTSQAPTSEADFLQPGTDIVAAGYAVYGVQTIFVYAIGNGVHSFALDAALDEFTLTNPAVRSPDRGSVYSVNEGNAASWSVTLKSFIDSLKQENALGVGSGKLYSARYAGSLVADFDRILRRGGIFLYPADKRNPRGKLRMLYEVMPLAFIAEQAGAQACGVKERLLSQVPATIHERSPFIVGTIVEMQAYQAAVSFGD